MKGKMNVFEMHLPRLIFDNFISFNIFIFLYLYLILIIYFQLDPKFDHPYPNCPSTVKRVNEQKPTPSFQCPHGRRRNRTLTPLPSDINGPAGQSHDSHCPHPRRHRYSLPRLYGTSVNRPDRLLYI